MIKRQAVLLTILATGALVETFIAPLPSISQARAQTFAFGSASPVSILNYTSCNGLADDSLGFLTAAASNKNILIPANAVCKIFANTAIPIGSKWLVEKGGAVDVAAGITLKIRSLFDAGRYQVFTGPGSVIGIAQAKPEWWGANGAYGNTDDSRPAFQAAVNSALGAMDTGVDYSDINGSPVVDIGQGFFNLCSPVDIYPTSTKPLEIRGIGPWNSGSWVQTCSAFTGYAPFLVHGYPATSGSVFAVSFKDLSINNPVRLSGATAGIRFVPEGSGYNLNALNKASVIEGVKVGDFPIGIDIANLQNLVVRRTSIIYSAANTSGNIGIRFYGNGPAASGNGAGQVTVEDTLIDACPLANASDCTNTTGVEIYAANGAQNNSIVFRTTIFYSSNTFLKMISKGAGSWVGDIWMAGDGNQFDGYGCSYIDAVALSGGALFNVHIDHVYHTGAYSDTCIVHKWESDGLSRITKVWDTNNHFVMGGTNTVILAKSASDMVISGNIIDGNNSSVDAISISSSNSIAISNNIIKGIWRTGIALGSGTINTTVTGNECNGAQLEKGCTLDAIPLATTTNDVNANSDRKFGPALLTLQTYIISSLPSCKASRLGMSALISNGTAYEKGTYGSAVSATGNVTRKVLCTNSAGAIIFAWTYN